MERKLYKKLWDIRFKKMLKLEERAVTEYTNLIRECREKYKDHHVIIGELKRLVADEKKHTLLVKELSDILGRQSR